MHGEHTPARFRRSLAKNANGFEEYDFNNDVLPVVNNVLLNRDAAITANDSFVAVTDKLASNIERLFERRRDGYYSLFGAVQRRGLGDIA